MAEMRCDEAMRCGFDVAICSFRSAIRVTYLDDNNSMRKRYDRGCCGVVWRAKKINESESYLSTFVAVGGG